MDTGKFQEFTNAIEDVIDYFQNQAVYGGRNPNWVNGSLEPYYKLGYGKFGRFSMTVSPGKGYNLSVHLAPSMGTIAKGTGKTLQEAIDNLFINYGKYFKKYLPRLPSI